MATRKSKLIIIALMISLAINLSIAGFVGAQWYKHKDFTGRQIGLTFDRHAAFSILDVKDRSQVDKVWKKHRSEMRSNFKEYRTAKRQLSVLLTAQELDKDAISQTHRDMMEGRNKIEEVLNTTLLDTAEILPPSTRVKFFKNGFQRWKSRHRRDGKHSHHPEGDRQKYND